MANREYSSRYPEWKYLDFATVFDYRLSVAFSRTLSIWIAIALLSVMAVFGIGGTLLVRCATYLFMWATVIVLTRLLAAMNKAHFTFTNHARWLESQVGEIGISSYWSYYLRTSFADSLTYAFIFSARLLNLVTALFVWFSSILIVFTSPVEVVLYVAHGVASLVSIAFVVWVDYYIRNEVDPRSFAARIAQGIRDAREQAIEQRTA